MKICVYGVGKYSIEIYYHLKKYGIQVDFFSDIDKRKWGYILDNVYCISLKELLEYNRNNVTIIIGIKNNYKRIYKYFKDNNFINIYSRDDIFSKYFEKKDLSEKEIIKDISFFTIWYQELCSSIYKDQKTTIPDYDLNIIIDDYKKRNRMDENITS